VPPGPCDEPGPSVRSALWRDLAHRYPALHPAEPLALSPDPLLITFSAEAVTQRVPVASPTLSITITQYSDAELYHATPHHIVGSPLYCARLLSLQYRNAGAYLETDSANPSLPL
jgi:hypothetical protein